MRGCLEKWPYPCLQWGVRNLAHFLELFQRTLCHPHTAHTLLHMADHPNSTCQYLQTVICMCRFKGYWDARTRHALRVRTPSNVSYYTGQRKCWTSNLTGYLLMACPRMKLWYTNRLLFTSYTTLTPHSGTRKNFMVKSMYKTVATCIEQYYVLS